MTNSDRLAAERDLRRAAAYIREHGFSADAGSDGNCRCFVGALDSVRTEGLSAWRDDNPARVALMPVIASDSYSAVDLSRAGWTEGCTDDAVAALEIAADLVAP